MTVELDKAYKPHLVEDKWYEVWEKNDKFSARVNPEKRPYCIVIPPPNITGSLHMGHALDNTIQDILIRMKRMQGFEALWVPGTDHAGIATQKVVEKDLAKEGKTRWDLGREEFSNRVWQWKEKYGGTIVGQLKRMGCSCDWKRERFTMDEGLTQAVREEFVQLYDEGKIYRGKRIINWCPQCLTALSNLEVEHEDQKGSLYHLRYPLETGEGGIIIATTRPETILADTAVAVNPNDPRYEDFIGKHVLLPLVGRKLPVIADEAVEIDFGTGALKITPAHDLNDYEIGQRHNLPVIVCMDEKGVINENGHVYEGMDRFACRKAIVNDLKEKGFLVKIEDYDMAAGTCYRCHSVVEPYLSEQWFVSMEELAIPAIEAQKSGRTQFFPDRYNKVYLSWLENLKDWCISRQLWWGHRIPVWRCEDCGFEKAYREDPQSCPSCKSPNFLQDENVLDTWFSSGLWPFSVLGWPNKTPELEYFYPTNVLVTARDIIFLWVARMVIMGIHFMGEIPFPHIYIHSTILNKEGRRMSKSLGTGVDPLDIFDKFGVDATRFGLIAMTEQGQDVRFSENRMEMSRNFANKIWNASRYLLRHLTCTHLNHTPGDFQLPLWDRWILSKLNRLSKDLTEYYETYRFDWAARSLYEFFWDCFCDWYVEITKPILYGDDENAKERTLWILETVMDQFLRLLHPVMPYITEEIWSFLPYSRNSMEEPEKQLITSPWASCQNELIDDKAEADFQTIIEITRALRNMRAEAELTPKQTAKFVMETANTEQIQLLKENNSVLSALAAAKSIDIIEPSGVSYKKSLSARVGETDLFMPLEGLVDIEKEIERLQKEKQKQEKLIEIAEKKCSNPGFLAKANPEIVEKEKNRLAELKDQLSRIDERINLFQ